MAGYSNLFLLIKTVLGIEPLTGPSAPHGANP